jgi:tetratricopeptide (TPR) repeat protein
MSEPPFDKEKAHRWFAVQLNNRAWDLLEAAQRTDPEEDEMVHAAHASVYHWLQAGNAVNHARSLCLLGNVYATLRRVSEALRYAAQCVELTEANPDDVADWDFAFAYDGLARATAAAGDQKSAAQVKSTAGDYGERIADADDKKFFDQWFASGNWHGIG